MGLIERENYLVLLDAEFENIRSGEGHCILLSGEAGLGKTALVKDFCSEKKNDCEIYWGTCDALFTPRPLAPLYDITRQMQSKLLQDNSDMDDRTKLFFRFLRELDNRKTSTIIIFEDIHWADEATLDFIKFFARRIKQINCLFIVTYRNDEVHSNHPLRNVLGQLPADSFTRLQLVPLSKESVQKMAMEKGYSGEDVYTISGGNPFYVNEILASYSLGIPDNIKDSVLSVYNRLDEKAKEVWTILSVLPTGFELKYLEMMESFYVSAIKYCLEAGILILNEGNITFKHELFRRTIETSLSPLVRLNLHKKILNLFLKNFEQNHEIQRIIHHAKNANEYDLVVHYAPIAAKQASSLGAHIEASRLYYSAIECYQGTNKDKLHELYEGYAYECYLINKHKEAIIYMNKSLKLWTEENEKEKASNSMRFLSRLEWLDTNREQAESFADQAIELLKDRPDSTAKAMAFSNKAQLTMIYDQFAESLFWGNKAIEIAKKLNDEKTLSHALNNVGTVKMRIPSSRQEGIDLLQQSLAIALKNSYQDDATRAYSNLGFNGIIIKEYAFAQEMLESGIKYYEERDIDTSMTYMLGHMARLKLETGRWDEAYEIADNLLKNENQGTIFKIGALAIAATIKMRRGDTDVFPLLMTAKVKAFATMELQRIIPVSVALLEYEWITGKNLGEKIGIDKTIAIIEQTGDTNAGNELAYWLLKARGQRVPFNEPDNICDKPDVWEQLGCPYEQALALFKGDETDKRKALNLVHELGADAVYEKLKMEMRILGIKNIPRGIRKATQSNSAHLTTREMEILELLKEGMQNKEIANKLFISAKTVDHHISSILLKLNVKSRVKAVQEAIHLDIIK